VFSQIGDIQAVEKNLDGSSQQEDPQKTEEQKVELDHRIDFRLSR